MQNKLLLIFVLAVIPHSLVGDVLKDSHPTEKQREFGPINDERAAIEIALEYFKQEIHPKGPGDLNLLGPRVFMDKTRKQWIVSWFFDNDQRIVVVVNAESGKAYQADTGVD